MSRRENAAAPTSEEHLNSALWMSLATPAMASELVAELARRIEEEDTPAKVRESWENLEALELLTTGPSRIQEHHAYLRRPQPLNWERLSLALSATSIWLDACRRALGWTRLDWEGLGISRRTLSSPAATQLVRELSAATSVGEKDVLNWLTGSSRPNRALGRRSKRSAGRRYVARAFDELNLDSLNAPAVRGAFRRLSGRPLLIWRARSQHWVELRKGCSPICALTIHLEDASPLRAVQQGISALQPRLVALRFGRANPVSLSRLEKLARVAVDAGARLLVEGTWNRSEFRQLVGVLLPYAHAVFGVIRRGPTPRSLRSSQEGELEWAELCTEFPSQVVADHSLAAAMRVFFGLSLARNLGPFSGVGCR